MYYLKRVGSKNLSQHDPGAEPLAINSTRQGNNDGETGAAPRLFASGGKISSVGEHTLSKGRFPSPNYGIGRI